MAKVKTNEDIKSQLDLQELVGSMIYRMQEPFKKEKVIKWIEYYAQGAKLEDIRSLIKKKVNETLNFMYLHDDIGCWGGIYYPRSPVTRWYPGQNTINISQ